MIGFLIKKGFFDLWDNLLFVVLMNIGFVVPLALVYASAVAVDYSMVLSIIIMVILRKCYSRK